MAAPMQVLAGQLHAIRRCFSTQVLHKLNIKVGDQLPDIHVYEGTPTNVFSIKEIFKEKKGILFSVPGAFTPGCSQAHIPEYIDNHKKFEDEGYGVIACVSVNDPFVTEAWCKDLGAEGKIRMLADMKCDFTKAVDMTLDCTPLLGNIRSKRYLMLVDDNTVKHLSWEPDDSGMACLLCIKRMHSKLPTR